MPHFAIKIVEGKTEEQKQKLARELVKAAQLVIGYDHDAYSVTIEEFSQQQWFEQVYPQQIASRRDILYKEPGYSPGGEQ